MKAINSFIVVEKIKEKPNKIAGLEITENLDQDNRYIKAKVITVGNEVIGIQDLDTVYYDKHAGHGIEWKEKLYYVLKLGDIVLVE